MKTRFAIAGLGGVADRIHLPACQSLADQIEVVGGCDPNPEQRERMVGKYKLSQTFSNFQEMLDKTRPEVVVIGTPPASHFELCHAAMEAGAHVFCEKPFMQTVDEAERIIDLAARQNLLLRVNNQYRFMSIYTETKKRLDRGDFGRLFHIQCWQQMFHPPANETNWRNQLTQYVLYEFATHALDLVCFFFNDLPDALNVFTPRGRPEYAADVIVDGVLRFPEERIAMMTFNRVTHAPEKYLEMRLDCEYASIRLSLGGVARLGIEWSKHAGRPILKGGFVKGGQARAEARGKSLVFCEAKEREFASATATHLRYFLDEMRKPQRSLQGAEHAREILRLVFAGYESARTGETVRLGREQQATTSGRMAHSAVR